MHENGAAGFLVHAAAEPVHVRFFLPRKKMMIEQKVRPLTAEIKESRQPVAFRRTAGEIPFNDGVAEQIVRPYIGHIRFLRGMYSCMIVELYLPIITQDAGKR
jgi:hypothetical protein